MKIHLTWLVLDLDLALSGLGSRCIHFSHLYLISIDLFGWVDGWKDGLIQDENEREKDNLQPKSTIADISWVILLLIKILDLTFETRDSRFEILDRCIRKDLSLSLSLSTKYLVYEVSNLPHDLPDHMNDVAKSISPSLHLCIYTHTFMHTFNPPRARYSPFRPSADWLINYTPPLSLWGK